MVGQAVINWAVSKSPNSQQPPGMQGTNLGGTLTPLSSCSRSFACLKKNNKTGKLYEQSVEQCGLLACICRSWIGPLSFIVCLLAVACICRSCIVYKHGKNDEVVYILRDCSLFSIPRCHLVFVGCSVSSNYSCNGQLNLQKQLDIKILIPLTPLSNNNCCYCGWIALPWSPDLRSFKSVVTTVKYSRWLHIHCINISSPLIKHINKIKI